MVTSPNNHGSGVIFIHDNEVYVLTASHILVKKRSSFSDINIVKPIFKNGAITKYNKFKCDVVVYSPFKNGHDISLLRVKTRNDFVESAVIKDTKPINIGTPIYYCGCPSGKPMIQSVMTGIISQYGRTINKYIFDQLQLAVMPGSSGGGVFVEDGSLIGLVLRYVNDSISLMVPARRISEWAIENKTEWIIDDKI